MEDIYLTDNSFDIMFWMPLLPKGKFFYIRGDFSDEVYFSDITLEEFMRLFPYNNKENSYKFTVLDNQIAIKMEKGNFFELDFEKFNNYLGLPEFKNQFPWR